MDVGRGVKEDTKPERILKWCMDGDSMGVKPIVCRQHLPGHRMRQWQGLDCHQMRLPHASSEDERSVPEEHLREGCVSVCVVPAGAFRVDARNGGGRG